MTEEDARKLAERIIATWPAGAKHYIWKQVIADLDHHTADVTYRLLRDTAITTPTPGRFKAEYVTQRQRLISQPLTLDLNPPDAIGRDEYLQRHPPATIHELKHWTASRRLDNTLKGDQ